MLKKFIILVIPESTHGVKRFSLHGVILPLALVAIFCSLAFGGYWFYQYCSIQTNLPHLQALQTLQTLQTQNQRQETQITAFARGLSGLKDQVTKLKAFNQRLLAMASPDKKSNAELLPGLDSPEGAVAGPDVRLASTMPERQMSNLQRDMAQLTAEAEQALQEELAKLLSEQRSILTSTPSLWPVRGWMTRGFGFRASSWTGKRYFQAGIDISTRVGTTIVAPADGLVTLADFEGAYGRMLAINHGHGLVTSYGHLHAFRAKVG